MDNLEKRKQKAKIIVKELKKLFAKATTALRYSNAWELLVAVILSAQCTDKKVNEVTEKLFKKYVVVGDYANAEPSEFEKDIHSTGFYRNKTKNILASAKLVRDEFQGKVPQTMEELVGLPGVARKTANIVLAVAFGKNEGVAVDTHVKRLSVLHGLTKQKDPDKIERDLMAILPKKEWADFNHRMVEYGRQYCPAKKHDHENCPLAKALKNLR
jgi:endonuclease-3